MRNQEDDTTRLVNQLRRLFEKEMQLSEQELLAGEKDNIQGKKSAIYQKLADLTGETRINIIANIGYEIRQEIKKKLEEERASPEPILVRCFCYKCGGDWSDVIHEGGEAPS
jgi:hypothetical protein